MHKGLKEVWDEIERRGARAWNQPVTHGLGFKL